MKEVACLVCVIHFSSSLVCYLLYFILFCFMEINKIVTSIHALGPNVCLEFQKNKILFHVFTFNSFIPNTATPHVHAMSLF